jgi:hypothetical protein
MDRSGFDDSTLNTFEQGNTVRGSSNNSETAARTEQAFLKPGTFASTHYKNRSPTAS